MESVLKKFMIMELMFTIMELLVEEQKWHNFWKSTFLKETKSTSRARSSKHWNFPGRLLPEKNVNQ